MLKYWQHNIGLFCLCRRHITCMPHVLARNISVKHLDNTLHLQDCHRRNTKISSTAGHEYVWESTLFLPWVRQANRCCSASRAVVSLSIPCYPIQKAMRLNTASWLMRRWCYGQLQHRHRSPPPHGHSQSKAAPDSCLPCALREGISFRSWREPQLGRGRCQVLLVLVSPRVQLSWHLPVICLKVLTVILVALRKAPGEVMLCWKRQATLPLLSLAWLPRKTTLSVHPSVCQHVHVSASILPSSMSSVIFEPIAQFQPKFTVRSKFIRSRVFPENQLLGREERSKWVL